ncbi:peptidylarginine deiminase-like enzyme [Synechococcus sp. PCC 7502]|uniref:agmatine deiminase family protein n=1 Tax=Synechococcus sp. PCC 7502 TaxID=1173263 RepID=UPI00029F8D9E|nr:agmatine deiminase family protein [Synechococcus sp. PCC 7502]AFY74962.1 peptidylarginine deiminase-like enzyme [Synechococcus sp. PCC 7502]
MLGYIQPAEWQPHSACWLAFPSDRSLWLENLEAAQAEFVDLAKVIGYSEQLELLVANLETEAIARQLLVGTSARFHSIPYGDIWMRDIAPIFLNKKSTKEITKDLIEETKKELGTVTFSWNGWGHKYLLEHDDQVAIAISEFLAKTQNIPTVRFPWVLEGGAVEVDGLGTCLTTKQCLLNPNRNPHLTQTEIEQGLSEALGVSKILWLEAGLLNDHTDGHIDTIARFIAPHTVICMKPESKDDPNYTVLNQIAAQLKGFTDATGKNLEVIEIPSTGLVLDPDGEVMPASYLNFYIANGHVIVPTYGSEFDQLAVGAIAQHFPTRQTLGLSAKIILSGGGAFHCITQQQPLI